MTDAVHRGWVIEFDEYIGLGTVRSQTGDEYLFHCTQISDGSRTIDRETPVTFTVVENRPKGPEAYAVTPD